MFQPYTNMESTTGHRNWPGYRSWASRQCSIVSILASRGRGSELLSGPLPISYRSRGGMPEWWVRFPNTCWITVSCGWSLENINNPIWMERLFLDSFPLELVAVSFFLIGVANSEIWFWPKGNATLFILLWFWVPGCLYPKLPCDQAQLSRVLN